MVDSGRGPPLPTGSPARLLDQLVERDRKFADTNAGSVVDRVRDGRTDARDADLADACTPSGLCGSGMSVQMTSISAHRDGPAHDTRRVTDS